MTLTVGSALVMLAYLAIAATGMSPRQTSDSEFGVFDARAGLSGVTTLDPGDDRAARVVTDAVAGMRGQRAPADAMVAVTAPSFYLKGAPEFAVTQLIEHRWDPNPLPAAFELVAGRWPREPGEVALTTPTAVPVGARLTTPDGAVELRVVGLVDDRYTRALSVLAAPGTWALLPPGLTKSYPSLQGHTTVYWSGGSDRAVLRQLAQALTAAGYTLPDDGDPADGKSVHLREVLTAAFDRSPAGEPRRYPWLEIVPAGYVIPSVLVPAMATALGLALVGRRVQRLRVIAQAVGVPARVLVGGYTARLVPIFGVAAVLGALAGRGAGFLLTPWLEALAERPVDLDVDWTGALLRVTAVTLMTAAAGAVLLSVRTPGPRSAGSSSADVARPPAGGVTRWVGLRRLLALASGCWCALTLSGVSTPGDASRSAAWACLTLVLLLPDVARPVLGRLAAGGWRRRLVARRLQAHGAASLVTVTLLAVVVGLSAGYLVLVQSWLTSAQGERLPDVAPGTVQVSGLGGSAVDPPRPQTLRQVRAALPDAAAPLTLRYTAQWGDEAAGAQDARTVRARLAGSFPHAMVVRDAEEAARLVGRSLTVPERRTLIEDGGALVWAGSAADPERGAVTRQALELVVADTADDDERVVSRTPNLVMRPVRPAPAGWQGGTFGVLTAATAQRLGLPVSAGPKLFTGLSDAQVAQVRALLVRSPIDPATVRTYEPPPPLLPAMALPAAGVALGGLMLALCAAATWFDGPALRRLVATLTCVGVPSRAAGGVVVLHHGLLFGAGLLAGAVLAVPPLAILVLVLPGYTLTVPWLDLTTLVGAAVAAWLFSLVVALGRLRRARRQAAALAARVA